MRPREFMSRITAMESIMGDSSLITITVPDPLAKAAQPGHFVDILCRYQDAFDPLLRRPYSIYAADASDSTITVLVRPFGRGSAWLCRQPVGAEVDVLGPLGNTYTINPKATNLLMVAGGVGAAPLVMLSNFALSKGLSVVYLMGSASADGLLPASALPEAVEYLVATDDGTAGHKGYVTDLARDYIRWADQIFTCGPEPMFLSLRNVLLAERIGGKPTCQVSMERTMACGLGACLGCVVPTKRGMLTSCIEGPVYDMDEVIWS